MVILDTDLRDRIANGHNSLCFAGSAKNPAELLAGPGVTTRH